MQYKEAAVGHGADGLVNAAITYMRRGEYREAKAILRECILADCTNASALYCLAYIKVKEGNWSDSSVYLLHNYFRDGYANFLRGSVGGEEALKLIKLVDETLSGDVTEHIQDCQYWYENQPDARGKKERENEFCAHISRVIGAIFGCAGITLAYAGGEAAARCGLNMLESCASAIEEVGEYLDAWVVSETAYTETKKKEVKRIVALQGLQGIVSANGEEYIYLSDWLR